LFEILKRAVLLDGLSALIIISMLLAFVTVSGNTLAQSTASAFSRQTSQSESKTPATDIVQRSGGGYLGVYLGDINEDRAGELGLKEIRGAVVGRVEEGSPAAQVGLQENDVILTFNKQRVQNRSHFHRLLIELQPGRKVSLGISRKGAEQYMDVVLGERRTTVMDERQKLFGEANAMLAQSEDIRKQAEELLQKGDEKKARELFDQEKALRQESEKRRAFVESQLREGKIQDIATLRRPGYNINAVRYQIGVSVSSLTEQLAGYFGAAKGGVLVTEVRAGELGEQAGLKAGDCIVSVGGEVVKSAADLNRLVNQKSPGELEFVIVRDRNEQTIKIRIDQK
jgi:C-terminal processing protease CtpA/Prc